MADENIAQGDEKCCLDDANPMETIDETSDVTMPLRDDVLLPAVVSNGVKQEVNGVNSRRYSTGVLDKRGPGKAQVQPRYRGNQMSSTHDLCKHGKRREDDVVIKPWKLVKKKNVESEDPGKVESLSVMRKSFLVNISKPEKSLQVAKREEAASSEIVKSCDGLRAKSSSPPSDSAVERKVKKTNLDIKKVSKFSDNKSSSTEDLLKNVKNKEKSKVDEPVRSEDVLEKKLSRISENKSTKEDVLKSLKNKEKTKIDEPVKCEDILEKRVSRISQTKSTKEDLVKNLKNKEKTTKSDGPVKCEDATVKTVYVVESSIEDKKKKSIKSVKSEIQQPSEKKILKGSSKKIPTLIPSLSPSSEEVKESRVTKSDPRPIRKTTPRSNTGLSEKKEPGSANIVARTKTESKIIRPKRIGTKATPPPKPTMQLYFKKGKDLEPKPEAPAPTLIKFKKRIVQEPRLKIDLNKSRKTTKDKREGVRKIVNGEGKREKVVLRHRKVEAKKKLQTLFNNVIEETVNKLEEVRKSKVKALVGAFETVISLQDDKAKTSQKKKNIHSESVSPQGVEAKSLAA